MHELVGMMASGNSEMRLVWDHELHQFLSLPLGSTRRSDRAVLIEKYKHDLKPIHCIDELNESYSQGVEWCIIIAKDLFPTKWPYLAVLSTTAVAHALRHVEIMTGRDLDARQQLPRWIREWSRFSEGQNLRMTPTHLP